ncbi:tautomerase family protein [Pseudotabrizicola formosa]|uniref:tautomerase family protein n=1 Tax=Pseudotabrizicola formosa TaxID=2030009 RepID=UPI000CD2A242|nr:tautomerase family protein [Pseudotabrizicola formosa]
MPIVTVQILEGYEASVKTRLGQAMTEAVRSVVAAPAEAVTVILSEMPAANYLRGGAHRTAGPALADAGEVVRRFLTAMEARDLPSARAHLAPGFAMTFPGGVRMETLEQLVAWAKPRYRFVKKTYERFDAMGSIVYCFGRLHGEWPDGAAFSGIRFIDRFVLEDGRILRQDVWNDIAESQARGAAQ